MKSHLAALLALAIPAAYGDLVITEKVSNAGQTSEITVKVGADKVRTDVGTQVSTITDSKSGDITTLMPAQKAYMVITSKASQGMMEQMKKAMQQMGTTPGQPKLVSTGKTEKVNGYDTAEYTFTNGSIRGTYWVAADYPNAKAITAALQKFQQGGLAAMTKEFTPDMSTIPGLPIKTEVEINGQKIETEIESAQDQAVDPSVYEVPAGYTEMKMPAMPQQPQQ